MFFWVSERRRVECENKTMEKNNSGPGVSQDAQENEGLNGLAGQTVRKLGRSGKIFEHRRALHPKEPKTTLDGESAQKKAINQIAR
jgi:hypothetical protein